MDGWVEYKYRKYYKLGYNIYSCYLCIILVIPESTDYNINTLY